MLLRPGSQLANEPPPVLLPLSSEGAAGVVGLHLCHGGPGTEPSLQVHCCPFLDSLVRSSRELQGSHLTDSQGVAPFMETVNQAGSLQVVPAQKGSLMN